MVGKKISVKVTDLAGQVKTSEATAAVEKDFPELANVLQESSNQILLMFDTDASEITTSDIVVERDEDDLVNPVEKVELLDPTTILATLSSVLIDDTLYNVTVGSESTSFTASVGEVASIEILTTEAEVNKPTKIEYRLLDKNGVDVTSTQKLKETVLVDITGTYKTAKTSDPTNISVTMGAVDDECEVTISYNKGTGSDESVEPKTQKIVCVGPTATKGTIKYVRTNDVNTNSDCARFYLPGVGDDGRVTVAVDEDTAVDGKPVYFAAFDDSGAAIEYEQYEVESANEGIVAATVRAGATSGKYTVIDLVGNEPGSTQVKVIATNNTVSKEYYINVTVKELKDMVKVILSDSRDRKISNAYDTDYTDTVKAKIVDDNGDETTNFETIEWKLLNKETYKSADALANTALDGGVFDWAEEAADIKDKDVKVKAWGAKKGTYTVRATVDIADETITQDIKIAVSELPEAAWVTTQGTTGVKLTYQVEVGSAKMNNFDKKNSIKLYAVVNGLFAGYVRQKDYTDVTVASGAAASGNYTNQDEITVGKDANGGGTVVANAATEIDNGSLKWTIKFGNKKLATDELYNYLNNAGDEEAFYVAGISAYSDRIKKGGNGAPNYLTYIGNDTKYDYDIARPGKYKVVMSFTNTDQASGKTKNLTAENEFTVVDVVKNYLPKVTLLTKNTAGYDLGSFKDILTLNVDLNNNDGLAESLDDLITRWTANDAATDTNTDGYIDQGERTEISANDKYAKYASVWETIPDADGVPVRILYFVPVGSNINED